MSRVGDHARELHADALTWPADWRTINAYGRVVTLDVASKLDEYAQFRVAILVDGKERWHAFFNDKSEDA